DRFRTRADVYDRENRFFDEDLEELKALGYLTLFVPESHGGPGLSLFEVSRLQQRLASAAPATAPAINMQLMCPGAVKAMNDRGRAHRRRGIRTHRGQDLHLPVPGVDPADRPRCRAVRSRRHRRPRCR